MAWYGLGKKRSKFGKFLDDRDIDQEELSKVSGISNSTISTWCDGNKNVKPIRKTFNKIKDAVEKLTGEEIEFEEFWS